MKKSGIKSIDIKIEADGFGIVNWNGTASLFLSDDSIQKAENHILPKIRGLDMHRVHNLKQIDDRARLYISQNCIRQAIFKDYSYGLKNVTLSNVDEVLCSMLGLVRGYVIAENKTSLKRKSSLYITDFVSSEDTKLNYEQFTQAGARDSTSIYSKHTTGSTKYTAFASINIEDLQFLPLEDSLGRSCFREILAEHEGRKLAEQITASLKDLDFSGDKNPQAIFSNNYTRVNSICKFGEAGILLNDDAIDIVVKEVISLIENLSIVRTSGYVKVNEIIVDYNSGRALRMKSDVDSIESEKQENYFVYYEAQPFTKEEYEEKVKAAKEAKRVKQENKGKQNKGKNKVAESPILIVEEQMNMSEQQKVE